MSNKVAGTVKEIRSSTESEQYDLAGYDQTQVVSLVNEAFGKELPTTDMLRFTFVVGAGKGGRARYRDDLTKELCEALRGIGFEEDRAASASLACQGCYKHQHDTDKNLKFLHVFPRVTPAGAAPTAEEKKEAAEPTPELLCAQAAIPTYQKMVSVRAVSFAQKRVLLRKLHAMVAEYKQLEERMMNREHLTEEEQDRYELLGDAELDEKLEWLQGQLEQMMDDGDLTAGEKEQVISQLETKLAKISGDLAAAKEGSKKQAALQKQVATVTAKIEVARAISPIVRHGKNDKEIAAIRAQFRAFDKIEEKKQKTKADVEKLLRRPGVEAKLAKLLAEDKSWFKNAKK